MKIKIIIIIKVIIIIIIILTIIVNINIKLLQLFTQSYHEGDHSNVRGNDDHVQGAKD